MLPHAVALTQGASQAARGGDSTDAVEELRAALVSLAAELPEGPGIDAHLARIAVCVPRVVAGVEHAAVTVYRQGRYATAALSEDFTAALDQGQQSREGAATGPAAEGWPQFRERAFSLGLRTALSLPLFAADTVIATLHLYTRAPADLAGLITHVRALYAEGEEAGGARQRLAAGHLEDGALVLLDALSAALAVHDDIQHAIGMLIGEQHLPTDSARAVLHARAATTACSLHAAALDLLARRQA